MSRFSLFSGCPEAPLRLRPISIAVLFLMAAPVFSQQTPQAPSVSPSTPQTVEAVTVTGDRADKDRNGLLAETGSSIYRISADDISKMPGGASLPFNQILLQAPGVVQDSYGAVHVRGDHDDLQYRLNGILLPESISGFGQVFDTRFFSQVNLLTGALPAEYGYRTAGVVDIETREGHAQPGGDVGVDFGSNGTRRVNADVFGKKGDLSYFVSGSWLTSDAGIENPTASNSALHDRTQQARSMAYLSYKLNGDTRLTFIGGTTDNRFEIPNTPGLSPAFSIDNTPAVDSASLNERQHEKTRYAILALQGAFNSNTDYQLSAFTRYSDVQFQPDQTGDLQYNGVASGVYRRAASVGLQGDVAWRINPQHTIRFGADVSRENLTSLSDSLVFPADDNGNQSSGSPVRITDNSSKTAYQYGVYLQDEWHLTDKLTLNYGARADRVASYINAGQISPRIGAVYQWTPTTRVHAGYSRYFTPPSNELISGATIAKFNGTTNQAASTANDSVSAERSHYFDVGINQQLTSHLTVNLDAYYKKVKSLLDEGQFGTALLYTPFNYERGTIKGLEASLNYQDEHLSGWLNIARSSATGTGIDSSQYNFAADELAYIQSHTVHLDHDQRWTASAGAAYRTGNTTYSASALFGSGLRAGFANGESLPSYFITNLGVAQKLHLVASGPTTVSLSLNNVFDRVYELRDGSGIGVGAAQYGARRTVFLGVQQAF